ncbi:hypothetical protein MAPG_03454 [Magnaporthiopsis poae ATCC 64411]|uniref:Uncharacterized protein n=1 Tax=Magnaporthiopsis poae (strain ATCC 64411 / 73-15) TaxID=644358 RepID=A0A0C4DU20_MAGP6|nr:hypothetical protein MAPG_03454 [Magnaporthiopsis poae ATCC 64411]
MLSPPGGDIAEGPLVTGRGHHATQLDVLLARRERLDTQDTTTACKVVTDERQQRVPIGVMGDLAATAKGPAHRCTGPALDRDRFVQAEPSPARPGPGWMPIPSAPEGALSRAEGLCIPRICSS